ncbi:integrase, partial [Aureimonas ureilytica]
MDNLAYSLKTLCQHNADGSRMTQAQRERGLSLIARELRTLGYRLPDARSIKPKHVERLVRHWQETKVSGATIKNRMGWLRWWSEKVRKASVIPRENAALGIGTRSTFKGRSAAATPADAMATLPERMRLAIRLQMAFGLR